MRKHYQWHNYINNKLIGMVLLNIQVYYKDRLRSYYYSQIVSVHFDSVLCHSSIYYVILQCGLVGEKFTNNTKYTENYHHLRFDCQFGIACDGHRCCLSLQATFTHCFFFQQGLGMCANINVHYVSLVYYSYKALTSEYKGI